MANEWIKAIKEVQKREGISYKEAMVKAASTYKRKNKKGGALPIFPLLGGKKHKKGGNNCKMSPSMYGGSRRTKKNYSRTRR
ncbi:MAG: hypothetical protein FJX80_04205 [Bacteroidetes bacterium]|nr:hypothetical protein [Bacteroidota bacterium]